MKRCNLSIIVFVAIVLACSLQSRTVYANTEIDDLVPNEYKENEFKKNEDLLHGDSLSNESSNIPEEQKDLTFEGIKTFQNEGIEHKLFANNSDDKNTIKAKADRLKLFASKDSLKLGDQEEEIDSSSFSSLSILISVLVGVCLLLLVLILVVWNKSSGKKSSFS
ncbi:type VII secretion protein EssA [Pseudalkalibacillus decolorationis]|uniref:type VII secretion protein EssA n=1 Tax=Pseudalkalibacillus decolorationis TaxID=163879 RepID=UPI002147B21E|nr:type VII secretion protein EssA [Pseudalkalibacillus decolorationis]